MLSVCSSGKDRLICSSFARLCVPEAQFVRPGPPGERSLPGTQRSGCRSARTIPSRQRGRRLSPGHARSYADRPAARAAPERSEARARLRSAGGGHGVLGTGVASCMARVPVGASSLIGAPAPGRRPGAHGHVLSGSRHVVGQQHGGGVGLTRAEEAVTHAHGAAVSRVRRFVNFEACRVRGRGEP